MADFFGSSAGSESKTTRLPLEGIRVVDSTYVFALPYTGALLADMGAEVIKVEGPGRPDLTRAGGFAGTFPENDISGDWWNRASTYNLLNRGKLSLTLDLRESRCRDIFRELVQVSDVVMENYTPKVMRRWSLDYESLRRIKPDIIMVSNTGYGHGDGPYSTYPAQATTQEGTHGLCWITGYPGGPASKAGASYVDFLACWTALFAIGAALRSRNKTGKGQWIDIGMYQLGAMFISEHIMDYMVNGRNGGRIGNRHPSRAPQGCYPANGKDQWITLSVGSDEQWKSLCQLMGQPELAQDERFSDLFSRMKNHDELDDIIGQWTAQNDKYKLMEMLQEVGIPAGPVLENRDTHLDPQFRARGFLENVEYPGERGIGTRSFIGRPWKFSKSALRIKGPAPAMGEHNQRLLMELLGMTEEEYLALEGDGAITKVPQQGDPVFLGSIEEQVQKGRLAGWDPDYRDRLGIS